MAIGREGQNARLAARLTGYKIDIKSETQAAELKAKEEPIPEEIEEINEEIILSDELENIDYIIPESEAANYVREEDDENE